MANPVNSEKVPSTPLHNIYGAHLAIQMLSLEMTKKLARALEEMASLSVEAPKASFSIAGAGASASMVILKETWKRIEALLTQKGF